MNDTCQTTAHSGDSLFSEMEDSGCQSADVPLARNALTGGRIVPRPRIFRGGHRIFPVFSPDVRAFSAPEPTRVGACPCGTVSFPA